MATEEQVWDRAQAQCELCGGTDGLAIHDLGPGAPDGSQGVLICADCGAELVALADEKHWYCLRESMWSEHTAVKVLAYRILQRLDGSPLAQELLGQIYLEPEVQAWADARALAGADEDGAVEVRDANGAPLRAGDTVTLIKDLEVKGANFTAKRGTTVKGILLTDDPKYVEGKVNGIRIVLVAAYLKKA